LVEIIILNRNSEF